MCFSSSSVAIIMNTIERLMNRIATIGGGIAVASMIGKQMLFSVDGGQRALIFDRFSGIKDKIRGEGIHFAIPFIQWPIYFDIRTSAKQSVAKTGTKDLQTVDLTVRVLYRPDQEYIPSIYLNTGLDYADRLLPSFIQELVRSVVA